MDLPASRHGPRPSSRTMSRLAFSWFLAFKVDIDFRFDFGANLLQPQNLLKLYRFYSVFLLLGFFKIRPEDSSIQRAAEQRTRHRVEFFVF